MRDRQTPDRPAEAGRAPLDEPPYYVIEVVPAITFTFGGLRIDATRGPSTSGAPVPGLLAAGGDSGGVYVQGGYAGGLANALTFGLRASRTALDRTAQTLSETSR